MNEEEAEEVREGVVGRRVTRARQAKEWKRLQ